jgi:hypothetical protein
MSETEQNKPVETSEYSGSKLLFWGYVAIAVVLVAILCIQVFRFVSDATREYETPTVELARAKPLAEQHQFPVGNEAGVCILELQTEVPLQASLEEDASRRVAPAKYLGWSLYNLDAGGNEWNLLEESRGDRFELHKLEDSSLIASNWYLLECSLRPGIFSGDQQVSVNKASRALEMKPELAKSLVYLRWSPNKKASPKPKKPVAPTPPPDVQAADDEPESSSAVAEPPEPENQPEDGAAQEAEAVENAVPEVDLRTSITGTEVEQSETVIIEAGSEQSAAVATPEMKRAVAVPPRKGQESAEIPAFADFEANLLEMDIKITWDVSEAKLVSLLEKYGMAFYAPTDNFYRSLDGDWTCFNFKAQKTLTQKEFWDVDKESALRHYGNIGPSFGDLPDDLKKVMDAALPPDFGGKVDQGILLLGSAILVANDAVSSFAAASGKQATQGAYEVQLVFTQNGEVVADSVKEKVQP